MLAFFAVGRVVLAVDSSDRDVDQTLSAFAGKGRFSRGLYPACPLARSSGFLVVPYPFGSARPSLSVTL